MAKITLLDGGMSRELERCGATLRQPEWSGLALMNEPEKVVQAHRNFVAAGAQVITTNSYAVVPYHLGQARFDQDGAMLADRSGQLARQAAATGADMRVAGCLPPVCGSYEPENFKLEDARAILPVLVENLAPHVDLWLGETLSSIAEARATAEAVAGSDLPLWISYTLRDETPDQLDTPVLRSGESVADAVTAAMEAGAQAVLFNCSMPEAMEPAIKAARQIIRLAGRDIPVGVYANAFTAEDEGAANEVLSGLRKDLDPAGYATWVDRWIGAG
ncbi:MAG: homocysteine S-methyltransferase family protein, partial [Paracoccus sp. (in: a-proteobacteria)]|nr:homocysteine S-methyltransferase family protein [Paracoccus sp. (in: a-proteobacteria)]